MTGHIGQTDGLHGDATALRKINYNVYITDSRPRG